MDQLPQDSGDLIGFSSGQTLLPDTTRVVASAEMPNKVENDEPSLTEQLALMN